MNMLHSTDVSKCHACNSPVNLRVFKTGHSLAVRLPKDLGFSPGDRVMAVLKGQDLVIKRVDELGWPIGYFDNLTPSSIELPARSSGEAREARRLRLFGEQGTLE